MTRFILAFLSYCLACEAETRHMYCFSGVVLVVVVGGGVNFRRVFCVKVIFAETRRARAIKLWSSLHLKECSSQLQQY